jgi:hypothetical protein
VVSVTHQPRFSPGERINGTSCASLDHRAVLDTKARGKILSFLPGIEPRSPGRPERSQTHVGAPVRLIIWCPFRPIFFKYLYKMSQLAPYFRLISMFYSPPPPTFRLAPRQLHGWLAHSSETAKENDDSGGTAVDKGDRSCELRRFPHLLMRALVNPHNCLLFVERTVGSLDQRSPKF